MKKKKANDVYRKLGQGFVAAVTCNTRLHVTLFVYSVVAVLLLTYVSAQVYTTALTQNITELKQERHSRKEVLNNLTSDYIALSSRTRVTDYCESVLGMVQAGDGSFERFAVEDSPSDLRERIEFVHGFPQSNDPYRFTLLRQTGKSNR